MTATLSRVRLSSALKQGAIAIFAQTTSTLGVRPVSSLAIPSLITFQHSNAIGSFPYQHRRFSNMPRPIVYQTDASPPSRAVRLTAAAIGLDIDVRNINLLAGEHLTEEFKKMNPEHTLPTLDDDKFYLWDSHAIMCYLVDKYGKNDSLYPKDLRRRALVNQRLYFEAGVLFARLRFISFPLFMKLTDKVADEKIDLLDQAYGLLDKFLDGKQWLAGDSYTLADISCVTTISSLVNILPIDKYPNVKAWLKRCEDNLPGYTEINTSGVKVFREAMSCVMKSKPKV